MLIRQRLYSVHDQAEVIFTNFIRQRLYLAKATYRSDIRDTWVV